MSIFRQLLALAAEGNQEYYPDFVIPGGIDENTLLMLHGDEYADASQYNRPVTNSNTSIVTNDVKFKSAFYSTGKQSSNYYVYSQLPEKLGTTFTVDFWFKPTSYSPTYGCFFSVGTQYTNGIFFQLIDHMDIIDIYICNQQKTAPLKTNVPLNVWKHWALVGTETSCILYLDGKALITWPAKNIDQDQVYLFKSLGLGRSVPGYFEEVRISNVARWTEDFEPPERPYGTPAPLEIPSTYTTMDYLQFDGTQYINTDYALWRNQDWKMEFTLSIDRHYDWNNLWGFDGTEDTTNEAWVYATGKYNIRVGGLSKQDVGYLAANTKYTIVHDNTGSQLSTVINGGTPVTSSRANTNANRDLCFGHRTGGTYFIGKLYEIKFWSGGELVRHLVPAIKDIDGTMGMYDLVGEKFYDNAGAGKFTGGYTDGTSVYTPVAYLESTGTQYIDTGIAPDTIDTQVDIKYAYTGNLNTGFDSVIGSRDGDGNTRFYPSSCDGTSSVRHILGDTVLTSYYDYGEHIAIFNTPDRECTVDNIPLGSLGTSFTPHTIPMYLFGLNCEGTFSYASKSRIYYCKIYKEGNLVCDLVPCINSGDIPGFYDKVSKTFLTNRGTGAFTYGSLEPFPYEELTYIKSTGTQWINLGIAPTTNMEIEMKAAFHNNTESDWDCMMYAGTGDMGSDGYGLRLFGSNAKLQSCFGYYTSETLNPTVAITPGQIYTIRATNNTFTVNGVTTTGSTNPISFSPTTRPMYLFAGNSSGSVWRKISASLYYLRIKQNGILVRDLVPVRDEAGVIGLYDYVSKELFTNQGSGTFIAE